MSLHVQDAALIGGREAVFLAAVLRRHAPDYLRAAPVEVRRDVDRAIEALRRAGEAYRASTSGNAETETGPESTESGRSDELMTTAKAAELLGVTDRRVRQLAAAGAGRKVGQTWLIDPTHIEARLASAIPKEAA